MARPTIDRRFRAEAVFGGVGRGGVAFLTLLAGGGALADPVPGSGFDSAGWHGEARTQLGGDFSYCVIRRDYPNGIELSLARTPEGLFFLGLKDEGWSLQKGGEASARLGVDAAPERAQTAQIVARDTVLFTFRPQEDADYAALLSAGRRLAVEALSVAPETPRWQFDLDGARDALAALERCVAAHRETASSAAPK